MLFPSWLKAASDGLKTEFDFYGHKLMFQYRVATLGFNKNLNQAELNTICNRIYEDTETDLFIAQLKSYTTRYAMDEMAALMLLNRFCKEAFKKETDEAKTIFKYVILRKKNIDAVLGYNANRVTLYGRTNFAIDNCLFIKKNNKIYYDLSFEQSKAADAETEFIPKFSKVTKPLPLVMNMVNPPMFNAVIKKKIFPFEYDGFVYFFSCNINQSLVEYYRDLPTISINTIYLNYGFSSKAHQTLVSEMKQAVSGMPEIKAMDFVLKFTQQAVDYRKDVVEKFAFPEETLAGSFADCEDKAILFATLMKDVLGLRTVALYYKDAEHINVAVERSKKVSGNNTFTFNNREYIVCEPSGKGLNPGESLSNASMASLIDW